MTLAMRKRFLVGVRTIANAAAMLFFPNRCTACDELCPEAKAFCGSCERFLEPITAACRRCALPLPMAALCLGCLADPPEQARAHAPFQFGGPIADAIRRFKWANLPELSGALGSMLTLPSEWPAFDVTVPVPLHRKRLQTRKYNQSALLAIAARHLLPPLELSALDRIRDTPPQSSLDFSKRRSNVRGAFIAAPSKVHGRRVLLVDDVLTTGATVRACARALRKAGATEVAVLTVARAVT